MPSAFVLLNVAAGQEDSVLRQLKNISMVEEAHVSYGVCDLVVKIKAGNMEALKETITRKIRAINLVRSTLTLILAEKGKTLTPLPLKNGIQIFECTKPDLCSRLSTDLSS